MKKNTFLFLMLSMISTLITCEVQNNDEILKQDGIVSKTFQDTSSSEHDRLCFSRAGVVRLPFKCDTPGLLCTETDLDFDGYRWPRGNEHKIAYCRNNITQKMKETVAEYYSVPKSEIQNYVFDHYIPLSIGGANDVSNIWPQTPEDADEKNVIEDTVHESYVLGLISQEVGVEIIRSWMPNTCRVNFYLRLSYTSQ